MVSLLVLLLGVLPVGAFASPSAPSACKMACCTAKPDHESNDSVCDRGCEEMVGHHQNMPTTASKDSHCNCEIQSIPYTPQPLGEVAAAPAHHVQVLDADLAPQPSTFEAIDLIEGAKATFHFDCPAFISGPQYATLGRAPPVLLA